MTNTLKAVGAGLLLFAAASTALPAEVEQWGLFELSLRGPSGGNPFVDVELTATFTRGDKAVRVSGFYDGDGTYRLRFMPDSPGEWAFTTESNRPELDGKTGQLKV